MKYKDLPTESLLRKLAATSFESPSANLKVYKWCEAVFPHSHFVEGERLKLLEKYGETDRYGTLRVKGAESIEKFSKEWGQVLDLEVEGKIPKCPIEESWFEDGKCRYPNDKNFWISPVEIGTLLKL